MFVFVRFNSFECGIFFLQIYSKKFKFKCNNNSNSKKSETPQKRANVRKQPIACVLTLPAMRCGGWWWVKVGKSGYGWVERWVKRLLLAKTDSD